MNPELKHYYNTRLNAVNAALKIILPKNSAYIQVLYDSMRYSVMAGGKRLRPILVMAAAEICGLDYKKVKFTACALELIHTYSLIHDDLPAMDNDDYRRGMLTNHKKFGEANAILTGDALLTFAFELCAKNAKLLKLNYNDFYALISCVSHAAGFDGMVGGQVADMLYTGAKLSGRAKRFAKNLEYIHSNKTAALIQSSIFAGGILARAGAKRLRHLACFGKNIGLAFQIIDDILDETKTAKELGKSNSDKKNKKLTYPAVFGLDESYRMAEHLIEKSKKELNIFGNKARYIKLLADYFIERTK